MTKNNPGDSKREKALTELSIHELEARLSSSSDGLSKAEVQKRLEEYGYNELAEKKTTLF